MKIVLVSEERIRLEEGFGPVTIESDRADAQYSPFHMLASSLGTCVLSVLASWAEHARIDASTLAVEIEWRFADAPHRVGDIDMKIIWPSLPPERRTAAERAAHLCAIHNTLSHPPVIRTEVTT
ncbi:MAG TPA: OsmC family protein [Gemmatimonadaceae bacterium]|nr:OsmC family protein [Gemmatimonadaceae bacterium]